MGATCLGFDSFAGVDMALGVQRHCKDADFAFAVRF
jgi:hypothetical protein